MDIGSDIAISSASRRLKQNCEHMSESFPVEFDSSTRVVDLKDGSFVEFHARAEGLRIVIRAPENSVDAAKQ